MRASLPRPAQGPPHDDVSAAFAHLNLIGRSPSFLAAVRMIERIAGCDATVLIHGETGTGKELVARAIHYLGARRNAPFVPINCGAIPETLIESELFGHVRGAFTDAKQARIGLVAQAAGGTLFLDEVDSLSARSQVALLRFLQDREYRPVGGQAVQHTDVRVIAATNNDLGAMAGRGDYRQDLLFRLNVLPIQLPPLREREDDALLLADQFVRRLCEQYRTGPRTLDPGYRASLRDRRWPGNVRELENLIHRAFLLSDGPVIELPDQPRAVVRARDRQALSFQAAKAQAIERFERNYLVDLLTESGGNVSLAARLSGKERSRLGKLLKKHGLASDDFRPGPDHGGVAARTRESDRGDGAALF